jgi:Bacterial regulatory proteins, luxR family
MRAPYVKRSSDRNSGWEGLTNREIGKIVGTSEQVIKNHLRSAFDKIGVWSRLELAMYVASHGGKDWHPEAVRPATPYRQAVGAEWSGSTSRLRVHAHPGDL